MSMYIVKQFPVITPEQIPSDTQWEITRRVAELTYFNHDLDGWAEELYDELTDEQQLVFLHFLPATDFYSKARVTRIPRKISVRLLLIWASMQTNT